MTVLLVVLPYGTAIAAGAATSGWSSIGGLTLGVYFFHKSMALLGAG